MGDIELVIKISEEDYSNIKRAIIKKAIDGLIENRLERARTKGCLAILEGTPLPKGHGRIGDLDALLDKLKSEIEQLPTTTITNWNGCLPDIEYPETEYVNISKAGLLKIIDKYTGEEKMTREEALKIWLPAIRSEIDDFSECQALDMAIKALEEEQKWIHDDKTKQLLDELSRMSPMVIAIAYAYAVNTINYGVDVTEKWLTVTENAVALERAYNKGYYDALQILEESERKDGNNTK